MVLPLVTGPKFKARTIKTILPCEGGVMAKEWGDSPNK
jgi:hypothetical protein